LAVARQALETLAQDFPKVPQYQYELGRICLNLARLRQIQRQTAQATADLRGASSLLRRLVESYPQLPDYRLEVAQASLELAKLARGLTPADQSQAESIAREGIARLNELAPRGSLLPAHLQVLGAASLELGLLLNAMKQVSEARQVIEQSVD